jgi:hypothetical protein
MSIEYTTIQNKQFLYSTIHKYILETQGKDIGLNYVDFFNDFYSWVYKTFYQHFHKKKFNSQKITDELNKICINECIQQIQKYYIGYKSADQQREEVEENLKKTMIKEHKMTSEELEKNLNQKLKERQYNTEYNADSTDIKKELDNNNISGNGISGNGINGNGINGNGNSNFNTSIQNVFKFQSNTNQYVLENIHKIINISFPKTQFLINENNNYFKINDQLIKLKKGNYDINTLIQEIHTKLLHLVSDSKSNEKYKVEYSEINNLIYFSFPSKPFKLSFEDNSLKNILGFKKNEYDNNTYYQAEEQYDLNGEKMIYIVFDKEDIEIPICIAGIKFGDYIHINSEFIYFDKPKSEIQVSFKTENGLNYIFSSDKDIFFTCL